MANFLAALDSLTPLIATQRYAAVVNGTGNDTVYAFGECMKDLSQTDCNLCFAQCKTQILRCLPFQLGTRGGRLFYDGCYLRYDEYYFFDEILTPQDRTVCATQDFAGNDTVFSANARQLVKNLTVEAPKNDGFSVGSVNKGNVTVYGLANCWELVNVTACEQCLANAKSKIGSCAPKEEGRVLNAGCYLRFSTQKFYYNSSEPFGKSNQGEVGSPEVCSSLFPSLKQIEDPIVSLMHACLRVLVIVELRFNSTISVLFKGLKSEIAIRPLVPDSFLSRGWILSGSLDCLDFGSNNLQIL